MSVLLFPCKPPHLADLQTFSMRRRNVYLMPQPGRASLRTSTLTAASPSQVRPTVPVTTKSSTLPVCPPTSSTTPPSHHMTTVPPTPPTSCMAPAIRCTVTTNLTVSIVSRTTRLACNSSTRTAPVIRASVRLAMSGIRDTHTMAC